MLRRHLVTFLAVVAALSVLGPGVAAKGRSGPRYFLPGDVWNRGTEVRFRSTAALEEAMRTDYFAYLVAPPSPAEPQEQRVARVELRRDSENSLVARAKARFVVPDVPLGRYVVTFCGIGCDSPLGRTAPTFSVPIVENEGQRSLFSVLDDSLATRRSLEFFGDALGRVESMTDTTRNHSNLLDWRIRALIDRVNALEKEDPGSESSPAKPFMLALAGGALASAALIAVASARRMKHSAARDAGRPVPQE